jgi:hypothetical protein
MIFPARPYDAGSNRLLSESMDGEECLRSAELCLRTCSYLALRAIHCSYHNGILTLHGRVPTFYMKQIAQELVSKASHVEIENCLEVERVG